MAFVPRTVEAAAKALNSDTLNCPLPLSAQSPRQIHQPLARHIISPRAQAHRLERMERVRIIKPRTEPPTAPHSKPYCQKAQGPKIQDPKVQGPKVHRRKRPQRRGKQPLLDYRSIPQKNGQTKKSTFNLSAPPVVDGSAINRREQVSRKCAPIEGLQTGTKQAGSRHAPHQPKTQNNFVRRKKQNQEQIGMRYAVAKRIQLEAVGDLKVVAYGEKCMGGKIFESNHSAVLAMKTIWCPQSWRDEQGDARWPHPIDFVMEGFDRQKNGYGRFLPVPRSEEFEWRLATREWLANPKETNYPIWNGEGPIPHREKRFAWVRSEMDCIIGTGRCIDKLPLFDRADELVWEDPAGILGKKLWEEIEDDDREGSKEKLKEEGEVSEEEVEAGLHNWLPEEAQDEMDKEVGEGGEKEEGRCLLEKLTL